MTHTLTLVLLALLAPSLVLAAANPDESLLAPYPGATLEINELKDFDELEIPLGPRKGGKLVRSQKVQGRWTHLRYGFPRGRSTFEVYKNYEAALKKGGFKIHYTCVQPDGCGDSSDRLKGLAYWPYDSSHYLAASQLKDGKAVWLTVDVRSNAIFTNVMRAKPMETEKVSVNAEALKLSIEEEGHVAVYGIEFDSGKTELKPASVPILSEIAKVLNASPGLKIYVVGHTDNQGGLDFNRHLSEGRATSVVKELVARYKIAPNRLSPQGVGPLVPLATNGTDAGRAMNRRVDLVKQ
jgi:outer membrane protein OmpA-like peptidoglycan-associated protein